MQSSSAVRSVFVLKGEDLLLDVHKPEPLAGKFVFEWKFQNTFYVARLTNGYVRITDSYKHRVKFSQENYSLELKNLQKADSGVYTAIMTVTQDQILAKYQVTVQERVSPVQLTVNSSSSDSCDVTVTCSSQDSSINCSLEGGERSEVTASAASIRVYLLNGSVICNHSNQVSWREDRMETDALCWLHAGKTLTVMNINSIVLTSLVFLFFCVGSALHFPEITCQSNSADTKKKFNSMQNVTLFWSWTGEQAPLCSFVLCSSYIITAPVPYLGGKFRFAGSCCCI
uniref:Immunoglobulin subtype domain-containing protein n=1 Tax=Myripristis murdjan TaxID=586833 RepID=A0A667YR74_9TELE